MFWGGVGGRVCCKDLAVYAVKVRGDGRGDAREEMGEWNHETSKEGKCPALMGDTRVVGTIPTLGVYAMLSSACGEWALATR